MAAANYFLLMPSAYIKSVLLVSCKNSTSIITPTHTQKMSFLANLMSVKLQFSTYIISLLRPNIQLISSFKRKKKKKDKREKRREERKLKALHFEMGIKPANPHL